MGGRCAGGAPVAIGVEEFWTSAEEAGVAAGTGGGIDAISEGTGSARGASAACGRGGEDVYVARTVRAAAVIMAAVSNTRGSVRAWDAPASRRSEARTSRAFAKRSPGRAATHRATVRRNR